jgi:ATPase subunit of ABC transporter with duplicated ATPase domains
VLRVRNLDAGYGRRDVLRRVTLHVGQGEVVAIVGANGAGKTTLLKTITGLVRARAGEITLRGEDVTRLRTEQVVGRGCSLVPEGRQVFAPMSRFSCTDMEAKTWRPSGTSEQPSATMRSAPSRETSAPSSWTLPARARTRPLTVLSRVVLPAPLAPTMATTSPALTWSETPRSTVTAP